MKIIGTLILATLIVLVGQMASAALFGVVEYWDVIKDGGAIAVVGAGFLMVLQWMLKRQEERMREQEQAMLILTRQIMTLDQRTLGFHLHLLSHELTITGTNPAVGEAFDERDSKAYQKFCEVQELIDAAISDIEGQGKLIDGLLLQTGRAH